MQPRDKFFSALLSIRSNVVGELAGAGQPAVIDAGESLDRVSMEAVRAALTLSAQQGRWNYVLDLTRVASVDSSGLAMLISALRSLRDVGGKIGLVTDRADVQRILELCARHRTCRIYARTAEAVADLSNSPQPQTAA